MTRLKVAIIIAALLPALNACSPAASDDADGGNETAPTAAVPSVAPTVAAPPTARSSAPSASDTASRMQADADAADACGASKVAPWIGRDSTVPVRSAVAKAAGAASDRWIYPDSVVTQDFRPDRLNVVMEKGSDRIVSAHCG